MVSPVTGVSAVPSLEEGVGAATGYFNDQLGGVKGHPPGLHVTAAGVAQVRNSQFVDVCGDWIDTYSGGP